VFDDIHWGEPALLDLIRESLDRAEQAAWEERQLTMVLDPVPVRVEARMRPDR
jgi:hypothetical protein